MSVFNPINKAYCLQKICESNYFKLFHLAPHLHRIEQHAVACADGKPSLYLTIIEKSPYTLTLELSHCFQKEPDAFFEPAVKARVYLDAKCVEVLRDRSRPHIARVMRRSIRPGDVLNYKWSLNYFLERWLSHCIQLGYRFTDAALREMA